MPSLPYPPRAPQPQFDRQDIDHVQNLKLAPNAALLLAAGQLAIMTAAPAGATPDRLLQRMLDNKREVLEYLKEDNRHAWMCGEVPTFLTPEERKHLPGALDVVWLIEDAITRLTAEQDG